MVNVYEKNLIVGMKPSVFAVVFILVFIALYLEVLPNNMLIGFVITMVLGGLLDKIGESIPGFRAFGGAAILCIITPALLVYWGIFPESGVEIVSNFFSGYGFVDFLIAALIVGSLLSMNREVLIKVGARFFFPVLGAVVLTFIIGGAVGSIIGFGFKDAILYVVAPIMGGGIGAGAIPMSEIYASNASGDSSEYISLLVPAIMVGNICCIFIASVLNGLGKRNKNMFKGFSGEGQMLKSANEIEITEQKDERSDSAPFSNLAVGIVIAGALYSFGYIIAMFIPSIHPYAWMILATAAIKIFNIAPDSVERASGDWFAFASKTWIPTILVAVSFSLIDIHQIISVVTNPAYLTLTILTVIVASVGAGIFGWLISMNYVESSITAGLCMADVGGSGDVAVLGTSERMQLMPFAQLSSRLGGAMILVIMSFLVPLLL